MSEQAIDEAALGAWLQAHVSGFRGPFSLSKFPAGQSNPTYRIEAASGRYVMRRKPFGQLLQSAHAVDREYRLLAALSPLGFPVPKPFALCSDPEVIGAIFYVMEMAEGRSYADGSLPDFEPAVRTKIYEALVDTLAQLHAIDPGKAGLGDFGKPGNYFERQVARWTRQYRDSQTDDLPEMEQLIEFLPASLPEQSRVSVVHGDYRIDNAMFDESGTLTAVLDWELATLGHPLSDLAYACMYYHLPAGEGRGGLADVNLRELGIPDEDAFIANYCRHAGRARIDNWPFFLAFSCFRMAAITQGVYARGLQGNAADPRALTYGGIAKQFAATGLRLAGRSM